MHAPGLTRPYVAGVIGPLVSSDGEYALPRRSCRDPVMVFAAKNTLPWAGRSLPRRGAIADGHLHVKIANSLSALGGLRDAHK